MSHRLVDFFFLLSSVRSDERLVSSLSDGRLIYREIYPITLSISLSYPSIPPSFIQPPLAEGLSWKKEKRLFPFFFIHYDDPVSMWRRRR